MSLDHHAVLVGTVQYEEVEDILDFPLPEDIRARFNMDNFNYRTLTGTEVDDYMIEVINVLTSDITRSGEHRINEWEKGWSENLIKFAHTNKIEDLTPRYHSKKPYVRWDGKLVKPECPYFDYNIHAVFVDAILRHYFKDVDNIFEMGCGPGYHLLRNYKRFEGKKLHGCDWTTASQDTIKLINERFGINIGASNLDFFEPDYSLDIPKNSGVYTVAALEQVGENFKDFIDFLLAKKPSVCVHMEPIDELLKSNNLLDVLSVKYFRKRNYLKGFLPYLQKLELEGKIEIVRSQRIWSGSHYIEGHSLIVWKPL